jgi:uncharacterized protein (TIGR03083 family)
MKPVEPILTVELFPPLSAELLSLLKSLQPEEWARPTVCASWSVKDVAAHLLGGNIGRLWRYDQTARPPKPTTETFDELVTLINHENEEWVRVARRISPEVLVEFLELTDGMLYQHFKALPADMPARITVAWAGDELPPNWFDIAREYTEKWLHQQHIRLAVGRPLLTSRRWLYPVLDTFMRALPHTYCQVAAKDGTSICFHLVGEAGGEWSLLRRAGAWRLYIGEDSHAVAHVYIEQDLAWQLFTKGTGPEFARQRIRVEGDQALGMKILDMVSIMA